MLTGNLGWSCGSQSMASRPAASASPGNFLEMQMLRLHPRFTESEGLRIQSVLIKSPGASDHIQVGEPLDQRSASQMSFLNGFLVAAKKSLRELIF